MLPHACPALEGGSFFFPARGGSPPELGRMPDDGLAAGVLLVTRFADLLLTRCGRLWIGVVVDVICLVVRVVGGGAGEGALAVRPLRGSERDEGQPVAVAVALACRVGDLAEGERPVVADRLTGHDVGQRRLPHSVG